MAVSLIGAASAGAAAHVTITTPQAGDLILVFAYNYSSATIPSLISGYTSLATVAPGGSTNAARIMYKVAAGSETDTGTAGFTTAIAALIFRGWGSVGAPVVNSATTGATLTFGPVTFAVGDGSSWAAGFLGTRSATAGDSTITTTTLTNNRTSASNRIAGLSSNAGAAAIGTETGTVTGSGNWITYAVEVKAAVAPAVTNNTLTGPAAVGAPAGGSFSASGTPAPTLTHQWNSDGTPIGGATASTYTPVAGDAGHTLTHTLTATNTAGTASTDSNGLVVLPNNTVAPAVTGTPTVGQVLTCSTGTWGGASSYAYQWQRGGANIGSATSSTYTLASADAGTTVTCVVTATNAGGSASATSNGVSVAAAGGGGRVVGAGIVGGFLVGGIGR